jgi:hypothetical protein
MTITLNYDTPAEGQARLSGTYETGEASGSFSCPIVYNAEGQDIITTEARTRLTIQESLDSEFT